MAPGPRSLRTSLWATSSTSTLPLAAPSLCASQVPLELTMEHSKLTSLAAMAVPATPMSLPKRSVENVRMFVYLGKKAADEQEDLYCY